MWSSINLDDDYIIKKRYKNGHCNIRLSDFVKMWGEDLTTKVFYERCKKLNPLVEGDPDNLIRWVLGLLSNESNASIKLKKCDEAQVLEIKSKLSGIPFTFKFYLEPMDFNKFYEELTLPLLLVTQQLQAQKYKLFELLRKKDVEISEYKMEGAQLSRRNIETTPFSEHQFEETCLTLDIPGEAVEKPRKLFTRDVQNLCAQAVEKFEITKAVIEASKEEATKDDSRTQTADSDSSPEKKRKLDDTKIKQEEETFIESPIAGMQSETIDNIKIKVEEDSEEDCQRKLEEKYKAKQRKEAMKKKLLPL